MTTLSFVNSKNEVLDLKRNGTERIFLSKLIYTIGVMIIYALARSIPLLGIDVLAYENQTIEATMLLQQSVGGDLYRYSIMALGISPYFIATILVQVIMACRSSDAKARTSPKKVNRLSVLMMMSIALVQAILRTNDLIFTSEALKAWYVKPVAVLEMITGVLIIVWLAERNKKYGIGGQAALILINILDGIITTIREGMESEAVVPILIAIGMMFIMLFMENSEKHIPVQRISIHNVYADKNYQAIKLNPIGIMPIMFASAAFTLPQIIFQVLELNFPNNSDIAYISENMTLNSYWGIGVYIFILYILNVSFSILMLSPKTMTEQFLKSGDSIVNIRPGKETKRYLMRNIWTISFFSSTVMSACLGVSLVLQIKGTVSGSLAMLPSSLMMLTGIWCSLYRESAALVHTDSYRTFI